MQSVCLYNKHWAAVIIRDLFKIDDWQGQVDSIKKAEASLRDDMEQHNSEELKSRLRGIDNTLGHVRLGVKAVESAIQDQTQMLRQIHRDENDQKCLQDLRIVNPEAHKEDIEKTKGGLFEDSYRWILDQTIFGNFELIPRGDCYGSKATRGRGRRCFYAVSLTISRRTSPRCCRFTSAKPHRPSSGVLYPCSVAFYGFSVTGRKVFEDGHAFESLKRIFLDMLKDPCLREAVFVVDALDECSDDSRKDLIDFILEASRDYSSKWVVSSRNWPLIEVQFRGSEDVRVPLELNKDSISQAVRMFIEDKVKQLAQQKPYTPELKDDVRNGLLSKANDTFLWVALVCNELARPEVKPRNTITKLKSIPGGLDELYQRMLEQVFRSENGDICRKILATVCITYRSISLDELRTLVTETKNFDDKELKEVIGECGSFLTLQEDIVDFVHQSAQDFLTDRAKSDIFPSGIQDQHYLIFRRSLDALMTLTRNIYNLEFPGEFRTEISCSKPDPLSHLRYSCLYWVDHLEVAKGKRDQSDDKAISRFISTRFLYWLEALSLQGQMSQGVKAVQMLKGIITNTAVLGLHSLVEDARRFILSHARAIEIAPLQAYASALVFSPEHSLTRELFKKEEPDWMVLKPRMEADWNAYEKTLEGHGNWVRSVVFSADGQRIVSGSDDKTVKIWDAATGACEQTLDVGGTLYHLSFDPTSNALLSTDIGLLNLDHPALPPAINGLSFVLTWCGERALAKKPPHGAPNSNAILGARAIQDKLLKDFAARSEFSDWFNREDDAPKVPVVLRPNPRNMELDEKLAKLVIDIKRLQDEKKAWQAIRKPPPEQPPLFSEGETGRIVLPDFDLLDPDECKIRGFLADETASFDAVRSEAESRLRTIQSSLEFQVDQLADNVHRLEQRVLVAGKEADKVLSVSGLRLRQREEREKASAGTRDMPVIEVLRSLGNILPKGGG
ncbi:hypothetical protein FPOA_12766 [Fusarium poae]|uniref:Uncharacterized protein n=1 Tax=Fusarium poae TaxID=36050 RepID=A0A1B8A7Z0_FUSPO|nr:hypothetical protein FPOA_12766 [Fusarium poae]